MAGNSSKPSFNESSYAPVGLVHPSSRGSDEGYDNDFPASKEVEESPQKDSFSLRSTTHLNPRSSTMSMSPAPTMPIPHADYASAAAERPPFTKVSSANGKTHKASNSSWDLLAGIRKDFEEFDTRNAKEAHLQFAQGDMPENAFTRFYNYLINVSIVTRWALFIVPITALLWIPGILGVTDSPNAKFWGVKLIWWSIWFTVVWVGWWAALAFARIIPPVLHSTVGLIAVSARKYIDWLGAITRYIALFEWTLVIWVTFTPLIVQRKASDYDGTETSTVAKFLFGIFLCAAILLFEKFSIQWIAGKFHELSYAERIAEQKLAIRVLVTLYANSSDLGPRESLRNRGEQVKQPMDDAKKIFKKALKGVRAAATTTTTALGNVASEIAGSSVLQPNSPQAMVQTALNSANKTRALSRRLFYSFRQPGSDILVLTDIAPFFKSYEQTQSAFLIFDRDGNGDVSKEEVELACLDLHREQLSIEHSMHDLDSAVGRLDNIFMTIYVIIAILIIVIVLDTSVLSTLSGAGTIILSLSWLIGNSLEEVLSSIIFLFIKHPYDVGDRVDVEDKSYTVKEIQLLSTIFLDSNNCVVQAPHAELSSQMIYNIRRSQQMSEAFDFEVFYDTSFEKLEMLREKMLAFVKAEGRDFLPSFDVIVKDIPEQSKMLLSADIKYKSNWQQGALKIKRRNKWICALKASLAELEIYGPEGPPEKAESGGPQQYTQVPWEEVKRQLEEKKQREQMRQGSLSTPLKSEYNLSDRTAVAMNDEDIFGDQRDSYAGIESQMSRSPSGNIMTQRQMPQAMPSMAMPQVDNSLQEYEMSSSISQRRVQSGQSPV